MNGELRVKIVVTITVSIGWEICVQHLMARHVLGLEDLRSRYGTGADDEEGCLEFVGV